MDDEPESSQIRATDGAKAARKFSRKKSTQYADERPELRFIPRRTRSTVSHLSDEHDHWGVNELDAKEEHQLVLHDHQHKSALLNRLNAFRRNRELCDVVLFVKEHEILAHKVVLASISDALFDMFVREVDASGGASNSRSREGSVAPAASDNVISADKKEQLSQAVGGLTTSDKRYSNYFEFAQGDYDCFEAIVNFAYTSKLEISSWKVADLYKTAYSLQVIPIVNACAQYLSENLSIKNCIGIRKQANFNNDVFLAGKVDAFIERSIEKIITESDEFTKLACIKMRIITDGQPISEDSWLYAEKALDYCQKFPRLSDRIDQQIDGLVEKSHLLVLDEEHQVLRNLCDADDQSSVGSCEIVQDYKRCGQTAKTAGHNSNPIGAQPIQHRVIGAKAVNINASRIANAKYASNESLNSIASTASTADDEVESGVIALYNNSPGFFITIAVLFRRIIAISIQLSENYDVIRSISKDGTATGCVSRSHSSSVGSVVMSGPSGSTDEQLTAGALRELVSQTLDAQHAQQQAAGELSPFDAHMVGDIPALTPQQSVAYSHNGGADLSALLASYRRQQLPPMGRARCSNGAAFVGGRIIVFGGYNRGECLDSAEEFDVATEEWRSLPPMRSARGRFDCALDTAGYVYAIAGSNGNNDLRTCERYDPKQREWKEIKSLETARSHNACTSMDGEIYCIGGCSDQKVLANCERYSPATNEWTPIAPLQTPRFQGGCVSWRGLIVYCAGCDRWNCLDTVEAYDPRKNSWRYLPRLRTPRRGCAVAVMRDALYVIGGHDGTQSLDSVEVLDHVNANAWRVGPPLTMARANTHAVVTARSAIYVTGGFNGNQFLDSIEVLETESLGWRNWQKPQSRGRIVEEDDDEAIISDVGPTTKNNEAQLQKPVN